MHCWTQRAQILLLFCLIWTLYCGYMIYYTPRRVQANQMIFRQYSFDWINTLCSENSKLIQPSKKLGPCPKNGIVTVAQMGRLGNQIFEYSGAFSVARLTKKEPFVPACLRDRLLQVFETLSMRTLEEIGHCESLYGQNSTVMLLNSYYQNIGVVAPFIGELRTIFTLKKSLRNYARKFLAKVAGIVGRKRPVFVGVHVRRDDYASFMQQHFNKTLASAEYFIRAMDYFRNKYQNNSAVFVVLSDDVEWVWQNLGGKHLAKGVWINRERSSGEEDFAVLASCNHSIIDYGTYGLWGALLAGGETIVYNSPEQTSYRAAKFMKNWRIMS